MKGLNKEDVRYRINNGLVNDENIQNSRTVKEIILSNSLTLFNLINLTLFILVITTGSIANAAFITSIIINTFISVYQEIKAKIIIDNLKLTTIDKVSVIRDSNELQLLPSELVIDDILLLKQGNVLPVDAKIVATDNLEVDESIITGESDSIIKKNDDMLISGSVIVGGSAYARVTSINRDTYANNLIKEASKVVDSSSYLMRNINAILKVITFLIIPVGLALFITQFFYSNQTYSESILSSVAGIIGMIPDGLVLLTSVSMTVGVINIASKKVIIQKMAGIELLACIDTLCLDKTGTITDGSLEVKDIIVMDKRKNINKIIANMVTSSGNATDQALYNYFNSENDYHVLNKVPFSSLKKYSLIEFKEGTYALGALEYLTNNTIDEYEQLTNYIEEGYRIITLVECNTNFNKKDNIVIGFVILKDNIRNNAKETLQFFNDQGVDIKIISGDNPVTVSKILKQLEVDNYDKYIIGNDLPEDFDELRKVVNDYKVFGRVTPLQKQQIVRALKTNHMVGYVGDGVNDILALKESDCGIALASGSSAARNVSEVVLTESDFGVLPKIVNEGRRVINNIERIASMYLIKTIYSFLISILCIFLSYEYPFYPIQLSLISIVCVGIPSFFLAIRPNYTKVEKGFLNKVFRNALPSGLCVFLNILFLIMISYIFKIDFEKFRFAVVAVTGYLSLRLLYNVSKPLDFPRKILVCICFIAFYTFLFCFNEILLLKQYDIISIFLSLLLIFSSTYVSELFEILYDKVFAKIKRHMNKRSRVVNEK